MPFDLGIKGFTSSAPATLYYLGSLHYDKYGFLLFENRFLLPYKYLQKFEDSGRQGGTMYSVSVP